MRRTIFPMNSATSTFNKWLESADVDFELMMGVNRIWMGKKVSRIIRKSLGKSLYYSPYTGRYYVYSKIYK